MFAAPEVSRLRAEVAGYVAAFDASVISAADAVVVVDEAARIEKMAATLKALAAARAADTDALACDGDASAAHALARRTGTSVAKAAEALRTARRLADQPDLADAARRGQVSPEQAAAISDAAAADPSAEARLLDAAGRSSLTELRNECERTKAAADADDEERHRRIHAARCARRRSCPDGSGEISYRSTRADIAQVWAVLTGFANRSFDQARRAGAHEPAEAYAADGMLAMAHAAAGADQQPRSGADDASDVMPGPAGTPTTCSGVAGAVLAGRGGISPGLAPVGSVGGRPVLEGTAVGAAASSAVGPRAAAVSPPIGAGVGCGGVLAGPEATGGAGGGRQPPPQPVAAGAAGRATSAVPTRIVVRIDWTALVRGRVAGDEVCEIPGVGPVAVSAVRAMMQSGDPFLAAVVTKGVDVVSVAHLGRRATAHQRTALDWSAPTCQVTGCDVVARLETDHRHDWADTHLTLLDWLDRLCGFHHDKKTYDGWALVAGSGKRAMVAPDDPRHPRHPGD